MAAKVSRSKESKLSQPLSGAAGKRIPLKNEKRNYMAVKQTASTIELRQAVCILLLIAGVVCVSVGAGIIWGAGGALIAFGIVSLILGVILGVF